MNLKKKFKLKGSRLVLFTILSCLIIANVLLLLNNLFSCFKIINKSEKIKAEVTATTNQEGVKEGIDKKEKNYSKKIIFVKYDLNGETYEDVVIDDLLFPARIGNNITIYVDDTNPYEPYSMSIWYKPTYCIIGLVFLLVILASFLYYPTIKSNKFDKKIKDLHDNGEVLIAEVIRLLPQKRELGEFQNLYAIECKYVSEDKSEEYFFKSLYSSSLSKAISGDKVPVLSDPKNRANYFVDISKYFEVDDGTIK